VCIYIAGTLHTKKGSYSSLIHGLNLLAPILDIRMAEDIFEGLKVPDKEGIEAEEADVENSVPGVALEQCPDPLQVRSRQQRLRKHRKKIVKNGNPHP
jgi:hypothetical protein